jgi:hypothetical protein
VRVLPEAAVLLISKGGFALPKTSSAAAAPAQSSNTGANGLVRLHHDDALGCSYAGQGYPSDQNGDVLVPAEAAAALMAHGFVPTSKEASSSRVGPAENSPAPAAEAAAQSALRAARR